MDKSNGYERIATAFIRARGHAGNGIGTSAVRTWAQTLPAGSSVLDLGCGTGLPVSKVLTGEGMTVYGVDASPTMVRAFQQNFPASQVVCEPVEDSLFFDRKFDGIIAWGLMFLLPEEPQIQLIHKASEALRTGGTFLFTSPDKAVNWQDVLTGHYSISLGAIKYKQVLSASGLTLVKEYDDEGDNHYFDSIRL